MADRGDYNLDLQEWLSYLYEHRPHRLEFGPERVADFPAWRQEVLETLAEQMGGWPGSEFEVPLDPVVTDTYQDDGFQRQRVLIRTMPHLAIPCWLLLPDDLRPGERRAAVLALHGHGYGKDNVVGLDNGDEKQAACIRGFNYTYAREFAQRGYVVLAPDHRAFGERSGQANFGGRDRCNVFLIKTLLFDLNMLLLNVWDCRRCLDYLQSRPDVAPDRLGCAGLSYGGTATLFTTAWDERIAAAVVSCYMITLKVLGLDLANYCGNQIPTGLFSMGCEVPDIGITIAPRPVLYETGTLDMGFPIAATREAIGRVGEAYRLLGVPERFAVDEFEGDHQWSGRLAYDWFERWLGGPRG
ncbi:MAG TPA: alpha/beta hydrolase family protein [Armatimonadota bacterium]|jgi:hypothetical protein